MINLLIFSFNCDILGSIYLHVFFVQKWALCTLAIVQKLFLRKMRIPCKFGKISKYELWTAKILVPTKQEIPAVFPQSRKF